MFALLLLLLLGKTENSPPVTATMTVTIIDTGVYTDREDEQETPAEFVLHGNYPNPFNPITNISFDLPELAEVMLVVVDITGRVIRKQSAGVLSAGQHTLQFDSGNMATGTYLYRITTDKNSASGRMTLIR